MSTRTNSVLAVLAACTILTVAPVLATDGEILVDQAKVDAGGITAGDEPGFPATLSKSGRYKLTGNLQVPAGKDGIEVKAHDVTIDLNGFTISSNPPVEAKFGVRATAVDGLRVINGTITGFERYGVLHDGMRGLVEDMRVVLNGSGVFVGPEGRIRNSTIAYGNYGISCAGRCLIEQTVVAGNAEGILITGGAVVLGNVIVGNGGYGLSVYAAGASTGYGNNVLFGNNAGGAQVSGPAFQLHPNVCEPACP